MRDGMLRCECGGVVRMIDDNGVTDASKVRLETHECESCGRQGVLSLRPDGRHVKSGCLG
jgi:hypothetical protein